MQNNKIKLNRDVIGIEAESLANEFNNILIKKMEGYMSNEDIETPEIITILLLTTASIVAKSSCAISASMKGGCNIDNVQLAFEQIKKQSLIFAKDIMRARKNNGF